MENVRISHISNQDRQGPPITVMNTKTTTVEDFRCGNVTQRRSRLRCWCRRHPWRTAVFSCVRCSPSRRRPHGLPWPWLAIHGSGPVACAIRRRAPLCPRYPSLASNRPCVATASPQRSTMVARRRGYSWLPGPGPRGLSMCPGEQAGPPEAQADRRSTTASAAEPRRQRGAFAGEADACTANRRREAPLSSLRAAAAD